MDKKNTWNVGYWLIALMLLLLLQNFWQGASQVQTVPYSEFEKALTEERIADVTISERTVIGRLKTPEGNKTTLAAVRVEPELAEKLLEAPTQRHERNGKQDAEQHAEVRDRSSEYNRIC